MKNKTENSISKKNIIVISIILLFIFISFVFFKDFYSNLYFYFTDFALHHYFYLSFIILVLLMILIKNHFSKQEKKLALYKQKIKDELLKNSSLIDKKQLDVINFEPEDVLNNELEKLERKRDIILSYKLGFFLRKKVRIFFKQKQSNSYVEDLVVHKDPNFIRLKYGLLIPIKSIYTIEFISKK